MTEKELIERKILLIQQSLFLASRDKEDWIKQLGGKKEYLAWIDEQLDLLVHFRSRLKDLE